jgi:hypothetical protein
MLSPEEYMLPCLNKKLLGFECMGCGGQRALALLLQGDFIAAFYMYPAIYTLIPLFLTVGINLFYKFRYANKIIKILAISSIAIIITSFLIKLIN